MDSCTILLPTKFFQVATIPATKLRHHMILKEAVITRSIQSSISEDRIQYTVYSILYSSDYTVENLGIKNSEAN